MPFGATRCGRTACAFAIWAPSAQRALHVEIDGRRVPMQRAAQGFFHCFDPDAAPGSRYAFRFDGVDIAVPDPASRFNPDGVHAASEVVDAERVRMARRRVARAPVLRRRDLRAARRHVHAAGHVRCGRASGSTTWPRSA